MPHYITVGHGLMNITTRVRARYNLSYKHPNILTFNTCRFKADYHD